MRYTIRYITIIVALFSTNTCFSHGLGFNFGVGTEDWFSGDLYEGDREIRNFGFVIDTAVAKRRIFNYRFTLNSEKNKYDSDSALKTEMRGISMTHDFAFGVFHNQIARLWVGPQLRSVYYSDITYSNVFGITDRDTNIWGFGVGPVIGVNFHLPQVASITISSAYHVVSGYAGNHDLSTSSNGIYFNLAIVFRINDEFKSEK